VNDQGETTRESPVPLWCKSCAMSAAGIVIAIALLFLVLGAVIQHWELAKKSIFYFMWLAALGGRPWAAFLLCLASSGLAHYVCFVIDDEVEVFDGECSGRGTWS